MLSSYQSVLLPQQVSFALLSLACFLLLLRHFVEIFRAPILCIIGVLAGIAYANLFAVQSLNKQLPESLEKADLVLSVMVDTPPVDKGRYLQFRARVLVVSKIENALDIEKFPVRNIVLNWYGQKQINPCENWQLTVRLKQPHGLANPGGFDYEAYLLEQGIDAKGYVREGFLINTAEGFCMQRVRQQWKTYVESRVPGQAAAWIVALSTGDKSLLNASQRNLLAETGISHLFVISGLHIGLSALAIYSLILALRRVGLGLLYLHDWRPAATFLALAVATVYAGFADFSIPSQRALIMLVVFMGGQVAGIQAGLWFRYWLAMTVVLLINPLSVLNVGFVLSFAAVFVLILLVENNRNQTVSVATSQGRLQKVRVWGVTLLYSQLYIFIGLVPFTFLFFSKAPLLAPLINIVAIPVMSFLVIPNILLALFCWCLTGSDGGLLHWAAFELEHLFDLIAAVHGQVSKQQVSFLTASVSHQVLPVVFVTSLFLLLPKVFFTRAIGILLIIAVILSRPEQPVKQKGLSIDVIDVGQGLSVLLRTANHQLIYDVGASWPDGSMVNMAVLPYLGYYGINSLDKVIISHQDNDHAGGIYALYQSIPIAEVLSSEPIDNISSTPCRSGISWQLDGVEFYIVHPENTDLYSNQNNLSCVLLIKVADRTVLIAGDIEKEVELKLVEKITDIDVLLAPHHGSKTSSSEPLVNRLGDGIVVFSSGYLNQFRHPHPDVITRYHNARSRQFITALQGAIHIDITADGIIDAYGWRDREGKYWQKVTRKTNL